MKKKLKRGSAEIVSIVVLVAICSITAIVVGNSTSTSTLTSNQIAQQAISLQNK